MRYLSLCSGIEAASVAWEPLGWIPVAFAETEPFAAAVLAHYWPHVPNLGDVAAITAATIRDLGPIISSSAVRLAKISRSPAAAPASTDLDRLSSSTS